MALATAITSRTFTNITTMTVSNMTKAAGGSSSAKPATAVAFEQYMCYKTSGADTTDLKGLSCWAVGFHAPTTAASATAFYNISVYNFDSSSAYTTTTAH